MFNHAGRYAWGIRGGYDADRVLHREAFFTVGKWLTAKCGDPFVMPAKAADQTSIRYRIISLRGMAVQAG